MTDLSFLRITGLALGDSVNPCAIAILGMILVEIMINNPGKKRKIFLGGLSFVAAVFVGYFFYGVILVQLFKTIAEFLRESSKYVYSGLAILTMLIGALNIKDYFQYKKGSVGTEMPLFLRPKVKKVINKVTSPLGAFTIGFFVTLFLLPCTIGPYIVASGLLSDLGILGAMPWLIYYNLIFVLPMLIVTILIFFSVTKVDEVTGFKDRHIRKIHLIAGILLFLVGLAILVGWI